MHCCMLCCCVAVAMHCCMLCSCVLRCCVMTSFVQISKISVEAADYNIRENKTDNVVIGAMSAEDFSAVRQLFISHVSDRVQYRPWRQRHLSRPRQQVWCHQSRLISPNTTSRQCWLIHLGEEHSQHSSQVESREQGAESRE